MPAKHRVIVVGGGLAGLACAVQLAEDGVAVDLFSIAPVRQSQSVSSQGGINACNEIARQQGYSEWGHFDETVLGGDFLADQPPVLEMCNWAPRIIDLLDRLGVPFHRTIEGQRALRLFGGSLVARTYFAGTATGQHVHYAFDEQVRRHEANGLIQRFEYWEFLRPVIAESGGFASCVGIVAQDLRTMQISSFRADAVVIAGGGYGQILARSTQSLLCTGAAASRCYQAGAKLGNPEFIQSHPTSIPGEDKCRVVSEAVRGEGGRLWVPAIRENGQWKPHPNAGRDANSIPEAERYYFLEERFPKFANLIPRDIATREIVQICLDGFGPGGASVVYLDLRDAAKQRGRKEIQSRLHEALEIYAKFGGANPLDEPMKVFPAVHYTMGGLWVDFKKDEKTGGLRQGDPANLSTNIPGLYAIGEANFAYHGANRLGANGLLSCIFDGLFGAPCVKNYCTDLAKIASADAPQYVFDNAAKDETDGVQHLHSGDGTENPYLLRAEMARLISEHCGVIRHNDKLELTLAKCQEWKKRAAKIKLTDTGSWVNQNLPFARATKDMILLAEAILAGALARNESRGAHYKPAFAERDDAHFLKATVVHYDAKSAGPIVEYEPVDTSLIAPRARTYGRKTDAAGKPEKLLAAAT